MLSVAQSLFCDAASQKSLLARLKNSDTDPAIDGAGGVLSPRFPDVIETTKVCQGAQRRAGHRWSAVALSEISSAETTSQKACEGYPSACRSAFAAGLAGGDEYWTLIMGNRGCSFADVGKAQAKRQVFRNFGPWCFRNG